MKTLLALLVTALSLGAADLTGNWSGTVEVPAGVFPVVMTLVQKGEEVTGAIATPTQSYPLQKAKLAGNSLSFEITADQVYVIDCVQEEERLTGDIRPAGGGAGKINVARSK